MKGKLTTLVIIFLLAIGVVGVWYFQRNTFSKEDLKLEILGPEKADLAQEIEYIVKYKNNGNITLENPKLTFEYPENSIPIDEQTSGMPSPETGSLRQKKNIADIYPGEEKSFHFKARLFGKENEAVVAKVQLSYQPKNLKPRYESATTCTTIIKSVPLTFEFDLPSRIEPGKDTRFRINYFSNVDYLLSDLRIQVDYPEGFEFSESIPRPLEKDEWAIPLLNRSEGGRIEISGKLSGRIGTQKGFTARIGSWRDGEFILLKEITKTIVITEPSLYVFQQINGNPEYIASPGDLLHYEISFKNIGNKPLTDLFLIVRLEGDKIDFKTIKSNQGKFESGDNSIVFDGRQVPKLKFLDSQEDGKVEFWIEVKEGWNPNDPEAANPVIRDKIFISQAEKEFVTKISSALELSQKGYFQDEVFGNSGPIPPKVGEVTTYTIMWNAKNLYNEVKNARVKATLPPEVRLTGKIFPEEQTSKFAFDPQSREIVWELGDLRIGKDINPALNISFQIAFAPTLSQKGQIATLIGAAQVTGEDSWTEQTIKNTVPLIDTTLPDDSSVTEEMGKVK